MKAINFRHIIEVYGNGLLNSYSQIFFSLNKVLAVFLTVVSFFDLGAGVSGVLAVVISQITARLFYFDENLIKDGSYTYNPLMVGLALGMFYEFDVSFLIILLITAVFTLFLTVWFIIMLGRKNLPFLSLPFLICIWLIILSIPNFTALELVVKQDLSLAVWFPELFTFTTDLISSLPFADVLHLYLRSLGAIFFQFNDLAGLLIVVGLIVFSRITFLLSVFGFLIGYLFYASFEGDFSQLIYSYIGFNFILTSIALGGFFVVPSRKSFLMLLFTIPMIALLISGLHTLFQIFGLPLYSLPFNIVTLIFLATMGHRFKASGIDLVLLQQFSPEKHHYKHFNAKERFSNNTYYHVSLPIFGEWRVPQGHDGNITHLGDWKYALDFDVVDENDQTYRGSGADLKDYFCYELPVVAPLAGTIVQVLDGIEDNLVGDVNLDNNWGNTVVIKHGEYFYSKISHFKKGSFKVKEGDFVQKGQVLGNCGSSGRSPEPHLHFQLQSTPYIGSKTLEYPIAYYLKLNEGRKEFCSFSVPAEGDKVSNVQTTPLLSAAFNLIPGRVLKYQYEGIVYEWEVFTDAYNQTYLYCHKTKSTAYFVNNGTLFYFTDFYGKKGSLLHHFYCGAQKVLLGYYSSIKLKDQLVIQEFFSPLLSGVHDLTAVLHHYLKVHYTFQFLSCSDEHQPTRITFGTNCSGSVFGTVKKQTNYSFVIENNSIQKIIINNLTEATCID